MIPQNARSAEAQSVIKAARVHRVLVNINVNTTTNDITLIRFLNAKLARNGIKRIMIGRVKTNVSGDWPIMIKYAKMIAGIDKLIPIREKQEPIGGELKNAETNQDIIILGLSAITMIIAA